MPRSGLHLRSLPSPDNASVDHQEDADPLILELDRLRLEKGISMAALARSCGMKRQQVSKILTGGTPNVGIKTIRKVAQALGKDFSLK